MTYYLRLSTYYSLCVATKYIVFSGQAQQKSSFDGRGRVAGGGGALLLTLLDARIDIIYHAANQRISKQGGSSAHSGKDPTICPVCGKGHMKTYKEIARNPVPFEGCEAA